ncbi:hypothetical protein ANCCAN_11005 [Ancylostoma caninum]|uniref:Uncharacterized protein n=1 Tax=Ancylostoma caninum TaxID=29170 RepID=A0A368GJ88_ANCCA|nr:hypothetical protein ANCCAN_11005 [Ancylostoma caninum]
MANLNFTALAIASVLLALCEGRPVTFVQPQCQPNGYLDKTTIDNGILQPINDERAKVAKHEQQNGMSPTQKLPPATGMTQLVSCFLSG